MRKATWLALSLALVCAGSGCATRQEATSPQTPATPRPSASSTSAAPATPGACAPPGSSCHPKVTITPSTGLRNGQRVTVRVTGLASQKVFFSECSTMAAANPAGCGPQLAAQPFLVTGDNGRGSTTFAVSDRASAKPYSPAQTVKCENHCVIVATLGLGRFRVYAYAPVTFAK